MPLNYAIGDLQGCYDPLMRLLEKIKFNPQEDTLWCVGDLVNRGSQSLKTLRFLKSLPRIKIVLGNHDLFLLTLFYGFNHSSHTMQDILDAQDCEEIIAWLSKQSFLHHDEKLNYVMVHAGIYPFWTLEEAKRYANELETVLHSENLPALLENLFGDEPSLWKENLSGWDRLRFIANAFTRMRFCSLQGQLEFDAVKGIDQAPDNFLPWFKIPNKFPSDIKIIFGHWAALGGITNQPNFFALDTGCVWGKYLTAMRLEDKKIFRETD